MMVAQSALWVGLLYDPATLAAADRLVRAAPFQDYADLRAAVPRAGLSAAWQRGTLRDLAREVVALAADGLRARARRDATGRDERVYLEPLQAIVAGAPSQAEAWLARYHGAWGGNVGRIFAEAEL